MSKLILGLGSNLNEPVFQLQKAVYYLKNHFLLLKVLSEILVIAYYHFLDVL